MSRIIAGALAVIAANVAGGRQDVPRPAAMALAPCSLPGSGPLGQIVLARDIADSGKRAAPKNAKALFKRATDVLRGWSPEASRVFTADSAAGTLAFTATTSDPSATRVPLAGHGMGKVFDATSGCALLTVPERGEIVAIDPGSAAIARTYTLAAANRPGALLLDAADRLLIVANDAAANLEVVNLRTMEVMDVASTGAPVRALALDSAWHRLYVITEDGRMSGYQIRRSRLVRTGVIAQIPATDVAVDSRTHGVYVVLAGTEQRQSLRILEGVAPAAPRCVFHHAVPGSPCLASYAPTR